MTATRTRTKTRDVACALDVETGGVEDRHPTTQIAVVAYDEETFDVIDELEIKLRFDETACDPKALKLNSYDRSLWEAEAITDGAALAKLTDFFEANRTWGLVSKKGTPYVTAKLVAHNAVFDIRRLRKLWGDAYTPFAWWYPHDTLQLALWKLSSVVAPPANYQLGTLCHYFGIEVEGAHDALADCRMTIKLAQVLTELDPNRVCGEDSGS